MKNLMLFIHPDGDFLPEQKTSIKIQIDNSLRLGWKVEDIMLATNFPYEYNGVRSLLVSNDNYCSLNATVSIINVIVELFERKLIRKGELYWYHDTDAYQLHKISEAELNLDKADMAFAERGDKPKLDTGLIFFKSSARDIFSAIKKIAYEYSVNEECAMMALYSNNFLWITGTESDVHKRFVPFNFKGAENTHERVKKLNHSYNFGIDSLSLIYETAAKPIKVAHFHFREDILLDSALYGENNLKKAIMPESLVRIFNKHGVRRTFPKKMKNLMIYINPEKRFLGKAESLVKRQIDNSLNLGWKKEDLILLTNFPFEYRGIKAMVKDKPYENANDKALRTDSLLYLLKQDIVGEAELWWFHDLDVLQLQPIKDSKIDLGDSVGFFIEYETQKYDTDSIFFRKGSQKLFEWMRNRAIRLNADEATALMSLSSTNYRNINTMYKKLKLVKMFKHL